MEGIDNISTITVKGNTLIFLMENGDTLTKEWHNPSRSESWTDEMRQKARERSQNGTKDYNHSVNNQSADTDAGECKGQA
jgi:hypothetical protein